MGVEIIIGIIMQTALTNLIETYGGFLLSILGVAGGVWKYVQSRLDKHNQEIEEKMEKIEEKIETVTKDQKEIVTNYKDRLDKIHQKIADLDIKITQQNGELRLEIKDSYNQIIELLTKK